MNKNTWYIFILLIFIIVSSCEYKTDEVYYRDVNKDVAVPDLTVDLNLKSDTIYVYNTSYIKLSLKLTNKTLYAVKFYLNNMEVERIERPDINTYAFYVDMSQRHLVKARVEIYTSTGTGSIADRLNAESFVYKSKEWVLIYNPEKPVINAEAVNGRLKLSWTPIKSSVRAKYYISASHFKDSTYNNWYIDSNYVGGYDYVFVNFDDERISGYGISKEINFSFPEVNINNRDSFFISWEKSKFYNNISGYQLRIDTTIINLGPSDTTFTYKSGLLGLSTSVYLYLLLKNYYQDNSATYYSDYKSEFYPSSFLQTYAFFSDSYFPLTGTTFYYHWSNLYNVKHIYQFSLDTKTIVNSRALSFIDFSVSPNNKYILCDDYSDNILLFNPNGLGVLKSIPKSKIIGTSPVFDLNVSDIGTSVFYRYSAKSMIVYDIVNDAFIDSIPVPGSVRNYKISADGNYVFEQRYNALYSIENGSHTKIWGDESNENQYKYFEFSPKDPGQIALYDGALFYIKNCSDFSTVSSFALNNTIMVNVDFDRNKILTYKDYVFYVYSLSDGSLVYTIPAQNVYNWHLFNDYIISNNSQLNLNYQ